MDDKLKTLIERILSNAQREKDFITPGSKDFRLGCDLISIPREDIQELREWFEHCSRS
jgi:hypothetical protein